MSLNRKIQPSVSLPTKVDLPKVDTIVLDNGLKVYAIYSSQEILKIDFTFEAGKWYEDKNLEADFALRLAREGTQSKSSFEINDYLDFYGASLEEHVYFSNSGFQLFTLSKYTSEVLPLLKEILTEAVFPEHEFDTILRNKRERLSQNLAKNDFVANRLFVSSMWGSQHPYGRLTQFEDFDNLKLETIQSYYRKHFTASNCFVILSGNYNQSTISQLNTIFGQTDWIGKKVELIDHLVLPSSNFEQYETMKGSVQSSIMIGNKSILRSHPDYDALTVLNTIFGGYFGSRLMSNIREEKGYTYGIYSSLTPYRNGTIFEISADTDISYREAVFNEIFSEIQRLKTELVDSDELQTVKNYMVGKIMRSIDGAFRYADVWKSLLLFERDEASLNNYLNTISEVTSEDMMKFANQYFDTEKMYKIAVG
jgi:predicted Zn-dependent peptidase